jgi:hypothetical protein
MIWSSVYDYCNCVLEDWEEAVYVKIPVTTASGTVPDKVYTA